HGHEYQPPGIKIHEALPEKKGLRAYSGDSGATSSGEEVVGGRCDSARARSSSRRTLASSRRRRKPAGTVSSKPKMVPTTKHVSITTISGTSVTRCSA